MTEITELYKRKRNVTSSRRKHKLNRKWPAASPHQVTQIRRLHNILGRTDVWKQVFTHANARIDSAADCIYIQRHSENSARINTKIKDRLCINKEPEINNRVTVGRD